jgi:hypothetical protein
MPIRPDAPLRRVTLNLYQNDVVDMDSYYGHGWTEIIRNLVRQHVQALKPNVRTLGDLHDDQPPP